MAEQRTFRALGGVDRGVRAPAGDAAADALRQEFDRVLELKGSLRGEAEAAVSPTGRRATAGDEAKLRTLVASVEGASRFAIRLQLLTPGQVRALWAEAMAKGLFDGWDAGQSAYSHAAGAAEAASAEAGAAEAGTAAAAPQAAAEVGPGPAEAATPPAPAEGDR
jgi:hypothetical protein